MATTVTAIYRYPVKGLSDMDGPQIRRVADEGFS